MKGMGDTKLGKIHEGDAKLKEGIGLCVRARASCM